MLAGMAALPALALVGCESDRTTADPISTVDTLDFANRLRIPALAAFSVTEDGIRVFRLNAVAGTVQTPPRHVNADLGLHRRLQQRRLPRPHSAGGAG